MGKISNFKNKSPETYTDKSGQPIISTESVTNLGPLTATSAALFSLLPHGPLEAGGSTDRIIVMFSGQLQWPNATEVHTATSATVGIYLDGSATPSYAISVYVPDGGTNPLSNPPAPVPFSLFWETPLEGTHTVDIKAQATPGTGVYAANCSLILITTPV